MLRIKLLGTFQLIYHKRPVTAVSTARLQSLLAYLVLHAGEPLSRQHLAFLFWPDSTESRSRTNLRKALFDLRHTLPDADHFLQMDRNSVLWLNTAAYQLDVVSLYERLDRIEQGKYDRNTLIDAVDSYGGELMLGCYDDWLIVLREQLHQRVARSLAALVTLLEEQREYGASIRYAQRLLEMEPVDEATFRRLMRLRSLQGDRSGALRVYHDCVRVLQRELGVEPADTTQELYARILSRTSQPESTDPNRKRILCRYGGHGGT